MGLLPDISRCMVCGEPLHEMEVSFSNYTDGLFCELHRNGSASALSADSWQLAQRMLKAPASAFAAEPWTRKRGQDLRRFTLQTLERHLERKLKTAEAIARMGG
jgi:DNA repair protein RecO (recombination protein O)